MNKLKPEDVMEEAECCGYATGCTDCVLAKYDGSPCIVKKALALLRDKDAEIERLKHICHSCAIQYGTVRDQSEAIDEIRADVIAELIAKGTRKGD